MVFLLLRLSEGSAEQSTALFIKNKGGREERGHLFLLLKNSRRV